MSTPKLKFERDVISYQMPFNLEILRKTPCVGEARLYEVKDGDAIQCGVCYRRCTIPPGKRGFCGARINFDGRLLILTYGDISSISANPIEKKPLYHFHPGSRALTIGSWGCNFSCPWCQNWSISKRAPNPFRCNFLAPDEFIKEVQRNNCQGTSFSFNEPTTVFFEYSLDVMPKAHAVGLYNTFVSNGYMTRETLKRLSDAGLDAINIDVKGCTESVRKFCNVDVENVWQTAKLARELEIWVEITTLVIPGVNETTQCLSLIAGRIYSDLGAEVPWHLSAYYPAYRAKEVNLTTPTPVSLLEHAHSLGKKAGLQHVYLGNVPGHSAENSYCYSCGALLVQRRVYDISLIHLHKDGTCDQCSAFNHFYFPK